MPSFPRIAGVYLTEARPTVLTIFALRFTSGSVLASRIGEVGHPLRAVAGGLVWESAIFFTYLYNGTRDVAEDRANGSGRPIARGDLCPRRATAVAFAAAGFALAGAFVLGGTAPWLVGALLALGYAYSGAPFHLKRRSSGTAIVGLAAGLLSYYAGFTGYDGGSWRIQGSLVLPMFALAAALWMGAVGTPTKDLPDAAGDAVAGRRTVTVVYGERTTRITASCVSLGLALVFGLAVAYLRLPLLGPELAMLTGAATLTVVTLTSVSQGGRPRRRRPYRVFMLTQYAMHLSLVLPATQSLLS